MDWMQVAVVVFGSWLPWGIAGLYFWRAKRRFRAQVQAEMKNAEKMRDAFQNGDVFGMPTNPNVHH
jgi:hypothetical protein